MQYFPAGQTEEEKLRLERDRLKQQLAQKDDEIRDSYRRVEQETERAVRAEKSQARLMKRASSGVCPCCTRTFSNVARHMKSKHPNVVPLEQKSA